MSKLQDIVSQLFDARKAEASAKAFRIQLEEQIAELIDTGDRGSKTVDAGNGVKITVKRDMTYKVDFDAIKTSGLPLPIKVIPEKMSVDANAYEKIREMDPELFRKLSEYVDAVPRKPSVTLKLI